ncbi:MAG TPA: zinc ABC transporter substrate-binding protein [Luteolibacter sp.]|nr:zinc ABC transporter substrate-binding protein [Luteolibacter sp.]
MRFPFRVLAFAAGLLLAACSGKKSTDSRPLVVATTTMVADLAKIIGGDRVQIQGLMGPGVDPHNYVPKLADTGLLEKADVVLYGGLHLEGRFQSTLEAMTKRGRNVVAVTDGIDPTKLLSPQEGFEGTKDPHVWGDPLLWIQTVDTAVAALSKADPEGAAGFRERGDAYKKELEALSAWASAKFAVLPKEKRVLVTSHDAFFYFGRAFGFDVRGLQGVSTAAEAGLKDRTDLVEYLRKQGVKTVFSETSLNAKGISAVAAEAGVKVSEEALFSDALGAPGDNETIDGETYDQGTYVGMLKHNVNAIVKGLN